MFNPTGSAIMLGPVVEILLQGTPPVCDPFGFAGNASPVVPSHLKGPVAGKRYGLLRSPKPLTFFEPSKVPGRGTPNGSFEKSPAIISGVGTRPTNGTPWRCLLAW